jgi:hypothetical protein
MRAGGDPKDHVHPRLRVTPPRNNPREDFNRQDAKNAKEREREERGGRESIRRE